MWLFLCFPSFRISFHSLYIVKVKGFWRRLSAISLIIYSQHCCSAQLSCVVVKSYKHWYTVKQSWNTIIYVHYNHIAITLQFMNYFNNSADSPAISFLVCVHFLSKKNEMQVFIHTCNSVSTNVLIGHCAEHIFFCHPYTKRVATTYLMYVIEFILFPIVFSHCYIHVLDRFSCEACNFFIMCYSSLNENASALENLIHPGKYNTCNVYCKYVYHLVYIARLHSGQTLTTLFHWWELPPTLLSKASP